MKAPTFDLHKVEAALKVNHVLFQGQPLTDEEIKNHIDAYRAFLHAHKEAGAPDKFEVPSLAVDRVWHTHMCETRQYERDCLGYFGKLMHHSSEMCNGGVGDWIAA